MTISPSSASRRYRDRSSFTWASATSRLGSSARREPRRGFVFRDDREDFDPVFFDLIEHPNFSHPEPVLGLAQPAQPFDSALADLGRLMPQVPVDGIPDLRAQVRRKPGDPSELKRGALRSIRSRGTEAPVRIIWTLVKIAIGLAIAVPLGMFLIAAALGVLGAVVGLAVTAVRLACIGLVAYGAFRAFRFFAA